MSRANYSSPDVFGQRDGAHAIRQRVERRDDSSRVALVRRVLAEFREMPCLRLTAAQAQRLFGLRADISARVIDNLVTNRQLRLDNDGRFAAYEIPPP